MIQLPTGISQNSGRKARFLKRVRYLQLRIGEGDPVRCPPEQWEKLPLGDLPDVDPVKIEATVWDLDRAGKARSYAVMSGDVAVTRAQVQGQVVLKLTSKISVKDYD